MDAGWSAGLVQLTGEHSAQILPLRSGMKTGWSWLEALQRREKVETPTSMKDSREHSREECKLPGGAGERVCSGLPQSVQTGKRSRRGRGTMGTLAGQQLIPVIILAHIYYPLLHSRRGTGPEDTLANPTDTAVQ